MASELEQRTGPSQTIHDIAGWNFRDLSVEQIDVLRGLSEDDLVRTANSMDNFAIVEALRRHRDALHSEEVAIKDLTWALVVLTVALVGIPLFEAWRHAA